MEVNILLTGVGGQGILTSSMILARAAMNSGRNVITAETHGMAQRGGSVEVHVRIGDVLSPLIPYGGADYVVSLELSEVLRYAVYYGEKTKAIVNTGKIVPPSVSRGEAKYPDVEEVKDALSWLEVHFVNASEIAEKAGNVQATNVAILGSFCKVSGVFTLEELERAVKDVLPEKLHEVNLKALRMGYNAI